MEVVTCIVHVVTCILNYIMFSLFICIIVNIVFILFYLQVEPVYLRVSNKCYPNHFCVFNIGNSVDVNVEASNHSNVARMLQVLPHEYNIRYIGGES